MDATFIELVLEGLAQRDLDKGLLDVDSDNETLLYLASDYCIYESVILQKLTNLYNKKYAEFVESPKTESKRRKKLLLEILKVIYQSAWSVAGQVKEGGSILVFKIN